MDTKFVYKGMDLTLDYYEKIRTIVELISEHEGKSFDECYANFTASQTYNALQNPETLMWSESSGFIFDEYYREMAAE